MNDHKTILWKTIGKRRKKWTGHTVRNNEWITTMIEEKIKEKTGKGGPRTPAFMERIMEDVGKTRPGEYSE